MIGETTRKLVYAALFAALTCVMTMIVKIPVPATGGYVNLGDCVVLLAGWVLGPMDGGAAAGLGSMLADLVSGYPLYAPGTFVIKACMAVCAWAVFRAAAGEKRGLAARIGGALAGEAVMVSAFGGGFDGVWLRQMDFIGGSEWCHSALVHDRFLAQRSPHSSASRPPSPSGKALATPYKLEVLYLLMINGITQSLPLGGRWAGVSRVG